MGRMEGAIEGTDSVVSVSAATSAATAPQSSQAPPQPLDVLWKALMELFKQERPSEAQLSEVSGIATLALRVAAAPGSHGFRHPAAEDLDALLHDVAEVGSLYGYWLGYHQGRQASARI